ncbi:PQQ-binding-like beta-propeller repeat protein [Streptomyces sp. NPDC051907]|uniref:outer membrane protein assembly factor BamB family protein n=1 Tax=Streptomyces sp. NPDC051907 TaxID=3155284 RepID=UPI0034319318
MTQPPSQQPPGGFGAPQDSPHGVPQPPAQPPQAPPAPQGPPPQMPPTPPPAAPAQGAPAGYGYPQQPGAQPQPGYGYPQQAPGQPGPYAQQPGPYAQQPGPYSGYPTQPQYPGAPTPPPSGGSGGFFKGKTAVVIGAAVAALLVIGGGTYFVLSGGEDDKKDDKNVSKSEDPKPTGSESIDQGDGEGTGREGNDDLNAGRKPGESKALFLIQNDVDLPRGGASQFGPWVVGDTVVKAMYREVTGYSVTDGKKKWSVPFPTDVCSAATNPTQDGKIVFGLKDGLTDRADCQNLQMVDLASGKAGWKSAIPKGTGFASMSDFTLSISGNTLAAGGTGNSYGFSMADGKQIFKGPTSGCKPFAFAGGPRLLAAASCPTSDFDKPKHQLSEVDPATGKPKWTYKAPEGWEIDKVFSASPVVVSLTQRKPEKKWTIIALDDSGKLRSTIDGGKDKFAPRCGGAFVVFGQNLEGCSGVAAGGDTFYMSTEPDTVRSPNHVVAFDLKTGKEKWRSASGGERGMTVLGMEGEEVLVYKDASYDKGGEVASIAPTGGEPKSILKHPASTAEIESSFFTSKTAYADGRFFLLSGRVSAGNDAEEKKTKTMMAFGK